MITKFKIFERGYWNDIYTDFEDQEVIYIDAYRTNKAEEEGRTIATIDIKTGDVEYKDERAKYDEYAQEEIKYIVDYVLPKRRLEIEAEKYNI